MYYEVIKVNQLGQEVLWSTYQSLKPALKEADSMLLEADTHEVHVVKRGGPVKRAVALTRSHPLAVGSSIAA